MNGPGAGCRSAALLIAAAVVLWLVLPTAPNYDTASHLVWAGELLHGAAPGVDAPAAPTPHPLWLLLAIPAKLTGHGAAVMQLLTLLSLVTVIACAWRLASRILGPVAGVVAALATASSFALLVQAFKAYVDLPFVALVLACVVLEQERRARRLVPWLLLAAGLLRPEAWAFGVLLLALRARRTDQDPATGRGARGGLRAAARRLEPGALAIVLAAPVVWLLTDLLLTGDLLHSLRGTRELAEELGRPTGLDRAPRELVVLLGDLARPPVAAAGIAGLALLAVTGAWRRVTVPLAVLAAACLGFLVVGAAGLPLLQRYLMLPAVLLCVLAGVVTAALVRLARGLPVGLERVGGAAQTARPVGGSSPPASPGASGFAGPARRLLAAPSAALRRAATVMLVLGVAATGGYLALKAGSFKIVADGVLQEARWQRDAARLLERPELQAARCGRVSLPTYRFVPELTLAAGLREGDVVSRARQLGGAGPQPYGIALVIAGDRDAKRRLGWAAGVPRTTNAAPPGYAIAATADPFVATVACPPER